MDSFELVQTKGEIEGLNLVVWSRLYDLIVGSVLVACFVIVYGCNEFTAVNTLRP